MADLKDKIEYLENEFKAGKPALDGQDSFTFIQEIINEMSADAENYNKFKDKIDVIFNAAVSELEVAPNDASYLLNASMMKNLGITSAIKTENETKIAIFKDFVSVKDDNEVFNIIDNFYSKSMNQKDNRVEVSSLLALAKEITSTEKDKVPESSDLLARYFNNENFTREAVVNVVGATFAFSHQNDMSDFNLTQHQKDELTEIVKIFNRYKSDEKEFANVVEKSESVFSKYFFSNDLDTEEKIHKLKEEESLEMSAGMISGRDLGEPIKNVLEENKKKARQETIDVELIEWEKEYQNYLKLLANIQVMSATEKFAKRFASHGFAPKTSNLFGDSIVLKDEYGDPVKTLWNISSLTGTMKLSRDVNYSDPNVCQQAFAIAALNARRNGWKTVYLNHPGPDAEAKQFLKESVRAMVEIGKYDFDEIHVPQKYAHVLDALRKNYESSLAVIANADVIDAPENQNKAEAPKNDNKTGNEVENKSDVVAPSAPVAAPTTEIPDAFLDDDINSNQEVLTASRNDDEEFESEVIIPDNKDVPEVPSHMKESPALDDYVDVSNDSELGNSDPDFDMTAFDIPDEFKEELKKLDEPKQDDKPDNKPSKPKLF